MYRWGCIPSSSPESATVIAANTIYTTTTTAADVLLIVVNVVMMMMLSIGLLYALVRSAAIGLINRLIALLMNRISCVVPLPSDLASLLSSATVDSHTRPANYVLRRTRNETVMEGEQYFVS